MPAGDASLLTQEDVRQLERLSLNSLDALTAGLIGQREGPGRSAGGVEFGEYRRYAPGDDLRRIDWHAYGRLRELLVNTTPAQARLWLSILLDTSASMGAPDADKLFYGRRLAALLGTVALLQSDAVQLQVLRNADAIPGGRLDAAGMIEVLAQEAAKLPLGQTTQLAASIFRSRTGSEPIGLAVLISDCLVPGVDFSAGLEQLRQAGRSAVVMHVLDPAEASAGPVGPVELRDTETGQVVRMVITEQIQARYAERHAAFRADIERRCRTAGVHYIPAVTDVDPLDLLAQIARAGTLIQPGALA
jgi:uncharacterized protein (DUF58 family)